MRLVPLLILLGASLQPPAIRAQEALFVEHRDKLYLVRSAPGGRPCVEEDGKRVAATSDRLSLQKAEEYAPFFISIHNLSVGGHYIEFLGAGGDTNHALDFYATFESAFGLENVFVVLEVNSPEVGKSLFLWEIGTLKPRQPEVVSRYVPISYRLGASQCKIHLFVDGREVFHSKMPPTYVDSTLDTMVAARTKGAPDSDPKPFVGPVPEFPPQLRRAKTKGRAVIALTVSCNGRIVDPQVVSATDPAFGEAALAATKLWRFLPRIVNGAPIETKVNIPFVFTP